MIESEAMNRKCPFSWVEDMRDFLYCQTDLCMSWKQTDHGEGHCQRLESEQCRCSEKEMTSDIDSLGIGA